MAVTLGISDWALSNLIDLEASIPYVYDDGDNTWPKRRISSFSTIGYPSIGVGHRIYPQEQERFRPYLAGGRDMPDDEIEDLLRDDIEKRAAALLRPQITAPITQSMWDAIVTQAFNTGPSTSTLKKVIASINSGDYLGAQTALANGPVTSKGRVLDALVKRRRYEASLFMDDGIPGAGGGGIPRWAWVSGISISALLVLWGAIRVRRAWVNRKSAKQLTVRREEVEDEDRDDRRQPQSSDLPDGVERIVVRGPRGITPGQPSRSEREGSSKRR
jgi:GH24 family phage-related lysozyme (muramidase)